MARACRMRARHRIPLSFLEHTSDAERSADSLYAGCDPSGPPVANLRSPSDPARAETDRHRHQRLAECITPLCANTTKLAAVSDRRPEAVAGDLSGGPGVSYFPETKNASAGAARGG